jgi:hypothetical protein
VSADCIAVIGTDRPTTGGGSTIGFSTPFTPTPTPPGGGAAFLGATEGGKGFCVVSLIVGVVFVFSFLLLLLWLLFVRDLSLSGP